MQGGRRKTFIDNYMKLVMLSLGKINWRHMILNIIAGPNGSLYNFLNQVWLIRKTLRSISVHHVRPFYQTNKSSMGNVNVAEVLLKREIWNNGSSKSRSTPSPYSIILKI